MFKNKLIAVVTLYVVLIFSLLGCSLATYEYGQNFVSHVSPEKYTANYDKMFDTAVTAGVKEDFTPIYQDKKSGLITFERKTGFATCANDGLHIKIQFGNVRKVNDKGLVVASKGFIITGQTICMPHPSFERNISNIEQAILEVSNQ